jgi:hypothetical protein
MRTLSIAMPGRLVSASDGFQAAHHKAASYTKQEMPCEGSRLLVWHIISGGLLHDAAHQVRDVLWNQWVAFLLSRTKGPFPLRKNLHLPLRNGTLSCPLGFRACHRTIVVITCSLRPLLQTEDYEALS